MGSRTRAARPRGTTERNTERNTEQADSWGSHLLDAAHRPHKGQGRYTRRVLSMVLRGQRRDRARHGERRRPVSTHSAESTSSTTTKGFWNEDAQHGVVEQRVNQWLNLPRFDIVSFPSCAGLPQLGCLRVGHTTPDSMCPRRRNRG